MHMHIHTLQILPSLNLRIQFGLSLEKNQNFNSFQSVLHCYLSIRTEFQLEKKKQQITELTHRGSTVHFNMTDNYEIKAKVYICMCVEVTKFRTDCKIIIEQIH